MKMEELFFFFFFTTEFGSLSRTVDLVFLFFCFPLDGLPPPVDLVLKFMLGNLTHKAYAAMKC